MPKGSGRTKNLRYGAQEETGWTSVNPNDKKSMDELQQYLFGGNAENLGIPEGVDLDDLEDVYNIDIDVIGKDANTLAASNIQNLLRLYNNKEFTDEHPDFKRRIDTEIESLRMLYKMKHINEEVHDHLVNSIAKHPGNASLYMALDRMQGKMLSMLNFARDNDLDKGGNTSELEDGSVMSRGNKSFIEQMRADDEQETSDNSLDPENLPAGWTIDEETGEVYDTDTGEVVGRVREAL